MNLLNLAMKREVELLKEISELNRQVMILRDGAKIAREACDRFCSPDLFHVADKWLRERGL